MDIQRLNEAFENNFKRLTEDESFDSSFDEEYAVFASDIDEDSEMMYKMYKVGNVSPADALKSIGYVDGEADTMISEDVVNGITYTKVFDFSNVDTYEYYVLKDGEIPSGWTATTAVLDENLSTQALQNAVKNLNGVETLDEDRKDQQKIREPLKKEVSESAQDYLIYLVTYINRTGHSCVVMVKAQNEESAKDIFSVNRGVRPYSIIDIYSITNEQADIYKRRGMPLIHE